MACEPGELGSFFAGLSRIVEIAEQAQKRLDRVAATKFSVFTYFSENEMALSRIFADLLNPAGAHGQGTCFLELFLNGLDIHHRPTDMSRCHVTLEQMTVGGRRVDIVLEFSGETPFVIGIENKPWAMDGDRQVSDYIDHFERIRPGNWALIYLSGHGGPPGESSIEHANWQAHLDTRRCALVSYRSGAPGACLSLQAWLEDCRRACEAERVRWFLKDCLDYIRGGFRDHTPQQDDGGRNE